MTSLSIDPSIRSCGWAVWKNGRFKYAGLIRPKVQEDWQAMGHQVGAEIHGIVRDHKVDEVYCEFPAFFGGSKGAVTASSGALVKLAWLVGFLDGMITPEFRKFVLVPVNTWKGQLPKEVIIERIKKILPRGIWKNFKADMWDAAGIGLYVHGRMK